MSGTEIRSLTSARLRRILQIYRIARDEVHLLRNGFLQDLPSIQRAIEKVPRRGIYLTDNSLPFHSAGYAMRSHGLVSGMRMCGIDTTIITRLGYPQIIEDFRHVRPRGIERIEEVPYDRLDADATQLTALSNREYIKLNVQAVIEAADRIRPSVIHAASNFVTGLTAVAAARALRIPSVYEVRGLWEITALSREPSYINTLHYAHAVRLETEACLAADRVIAITGALKDELVRRGVPSGKIDVVPNGVDTGRFSPGSRDVALGLRLGLTPEHVVIGYVGSILDYEGLDDLLHAVRICIDQGVANLRLLIVGDGAAYESCVALAEDLELGEHVIFTGRVPHHEAEAYYSLIDITPFPRKPLPVCEMVSPLKPFEAMAMGKCVVVSSVAALAEIVGDRPIGFVYQKGSVDDLARTLLRVASDRDLRVKVGQEARLFVAAERDWRFLAQRVIEVYEKLPGWKMESV
ncbi:glycosyltransferase family 4 protein [Microvirga makkahensis]|uniref:Glycosyltransferase n=1 Tax=Microvirga makkahensis TaxID=1128670 RepID=A0A7X3SQ30_9HYPH|nr:glycosyltransferase family 4 protein [Microvirga makkahensis]MXQ12890.1 glycosyltransferase [Microvirga makkahensis]